MEHDTGYRDYTITRVSELSEDGSCALALDDGMCFFFPPGHALPQVGQGIRLYGPVFGPMRGIVLDGQVLYYRTPAEEQSFREAERRTMREEERKRYEVGLPEMKRQIAALPEPFQQRLHGFVERAPRTAWSSQGYELATCQAALAIAAACLTPEAVNAYRYLRYEEQISLVPALESMGLSGNMFGMAVALAHAFLATPERIWKMHATICPIIGCAEAGCWVTEAASK